MSELARPKAIPLAVLLLLICVSAGSLAQTPTPPPATSQLSLDDALRLANAQASIFQAALLNERLASEDLRQAQAAFLPKVSTPLSYVYTSPAPGLPPGEPRGPSFVTSDGIGVYD